MTRTRRLIAVAGGLLGFGVAYNALVERLERAGHDRGYTALLVVGGTAVTLAGHALARGLDAAAEVGLLFAASGAPMIIGSAWRYAARRAADERAAAALVHRELEEVSQHGRLASDWRHAVAAAGAPWHRR